MNPECVVVKVMNSVKECPAAGASAAPRSPEGLHVEFFNSEGFITNTVNEGKSASVVCHGSYRGEGIGACPSAGGSLVPG